MNLMKWECGIPGKKAVSVMPLLSYQIQFLLFNCWVNFFLGVGNASNDINLIFSVYSALLRKNFKWIY